MCASELIIKPLLYAPHAPGVQHIGGARALHELQGAQGVYTETFKQTVKGKKS